MSGDGHTQYFFQTIISVFLNFFWWKLIVKVFYGFYRNSVKLIYPVN
jgi:hypothetical protein